MSRARKTFDGLPDGLAGLGEWTISEFKSEEAGLTVRGRFRISPFQKLDTEQTKFLITFLRCRGVLSSIERELGISYPTARARLDALLKALDLAPAAEPTPDQKRRLAERRKEVLEKLEAGEMTPDEAKQAMKEAVK
ncbi:MAG: DUF2089 family protein [Armatimonadetes bacterium]|nr:DUF2089 family protein [Armatimonadota bacterium]